MLRKLSADPATAVAVGSDIALPEAMLGGSATGIGSGLLLQALRASAAKEPGVDSLVNTSIRVGDLGLAATQGLQLAGVSLPQGPNTLLSVTTLIVGGAGTYRALTSKDKNSLKIAVSSAKTAALLADVVAPFVPVLRPFQNQIKGLALLLQVGDLGTDVFQLHCKAGDQNLWGD